MAHTFSGTPEVGRGGFLCSSVRVYALLALLLLPLRAAHAQSPPLAAPKPPTLASALAVLPPPAGLLMTVGADTAALPKNAVLPSASASVDDIAQAFGCQTHAFGVVTALAPMTMVVLNEDPAPPNIAADLAPGFVFPMLAASLDDAQWHALTSDAGLGLGDLTDDAQRGLFHGLFRHGQFFVTSNDPELAKLPADKRTDIQDMTNQIDSVRLRMGQTSSIYVHDSKGDTVFYSDPDPANSQGMTVYNPKRDTPVAEHAVALRAVVPNVSKDSQLNTSGPAFQAAISLAGLRTVGDLVLRIGAQTHTELYADPHYASRLLTILGSAPAAPAADLVRALMLCVTGAFRRVGPAFVLTDDLSGVGTRRQKLSDWEDQSRSLTSRIKDQATESLLARHGKEARFAPSFGDPMALTPDQIKSEKLSDLVPGMPDYDANTVPFAQLTPAQQEAATRIADDYNAKRASGGLPGYLSDSRHQAADLAKPVSLNPQTHLQFLVPSLSAPVEANFGTQDMMFFYWPGDEALYANGHAAEIARAAAHLKPAPPLAPLLRSGARHALIAHPRTAADVDALLPAMQKLGLNELWLDVFSDGQAHVPGSPLSPSHPFDGADILTEALKLAPAAHITVYADMTLLTWGDNPPAALADLNIRGENTTEAAVRKNAEAPDHNFDDDGKLIPFAAPGVDVNPLAARQTLADLVHVLAAQPGLAGFVWHGSVPDDDRGYTPAMRLAFLRARHADPVDIDPTQYLRVDVSLPVWDDAAVNNALSGQWDSLRIQAGMDTLRALRQAATVSHGPPLPILMEQNTDNIYWLASWDNPRADPPPLRSVFSGDSRPTHAQILAAARSQGRIVVRDIDIKNTGDTDALARLLQDPDTSGLGDGYVLDFRDDDATRGPHPLDALLHAVQSVPHAP